jgi:hypothetical protein
VLHERSSYRATQSEPVISRRCSQIWRKLAYLSPDADGDVICLKALDIVSFDDLIDLDSLHDVGKPNVHNITMLIDTLATLSGETFKLQLLVMELARYMRIGARNNCFAYLQ